MGTMTASRSGICSSISRRDGALPGHDGGVVEGMEEDHAFPFAEPRGFDAGFVVVGAVEDDLRTEVPRSRHLDQRGGERHDDDGADAEAGRVVGDTLRMVAGACRNDTAPRFFGG